MINWSLLQFIRPMWLLALLPLVLLLWVVIRKATITSSWRHAIDPHLLPHLLLGTESRKRYFPLITLGLGLVIAIIALAGPTWSKLPQPVYQAEITRMILLDLSRSMDVQDTKPSRLERAKYKVMDTLGKSKEGQVGMVVYAGEPYVVSPLTQDSATIAAMVPTLITPLMPAQGSQLGQALIKVDQLFKQSGAQHGDVLVITDGVGDEGAIEAAKVMKNAGHRISVLGVGTEQGAPIPLPNGGFYKDRSGSIVIPKYRAHELKKLAQAGGGIYAKIAVDDSDIDRFLALSNATGFVSDDESQKQITDVWLDQGAWLLFLLLPMALMVFRREMLVLVVVVLIVPVPEIVYAGVLDELWLRKDQRAAKLMQEEKFEQAAQEFVNSDWKGSALYRSGKYPDAVEQFSNANSPDANYNLGNALARAGKIDDAIKAYQRALDVNSSHEDAKFNKDLLEKIKRDQQDQQSEKNQSGNEQNPDSADQSKNQKDDKGNQQNNDGSDKNASQNQDEAQDSSQNARSQQNEDKQDADSDKESGQAAGNEMEQKDNKQSDENKSAQAKNKHNEDSETNEANEKDQATEQWLSKIKDDPGGLLRQKFLLEHKRRQANPSSAGSVSGEQW